MKSKTQDLNDSEENAWNANWIPNDWTPEKGFSASSNLNKRSYPRPASGSGSQCGVIYAI